MCELIDDSGCIYIPELSSDQEKADTKVCLPTLNALKANPNKYVIVRSHSGNVDINVLLTSFITESIDKVFVDINTGKNRKVIQLSDVQLSIDEKIALIGFYAFTGNDYDSSFFGKGKQKCWKVLKINYLYLAAFKSLGSSWDLDDETFKILEGYVCRLYGRKKEERVNEARYNMFKETYEKNTFFQICLFYRHARKH